MPPVENIYIMVWTQLGGRIFYLQSTVHPLLFQLKPTAGLRSCLTKEKGRPRINFIIVNAPYFEQKRIYIFK